MRKLARGGEWTYNVATPKMPVNSVICSFVVRSRQRTGMGFFVRILGSAEFHPLKEDN